ncbi:MAG: sugar phosphate isomerase/epimerase [Planctomycetaceae bacterium]|nr:sugar phosphate isomerase/epimerase [Planctomycetaceae bacterium]
MSLINNRRQFLKSASLMASAVLGGAPLMAANTVQTGEFRGRIRKAVKYHMITDKLTTIDKLKMLRDIGFDGVEARAQLDPTKADEIKELADAREKTDFPIHGVVNSSNPDIRGAIDQAKMLGANSVLHVVRYDQSIGYLQNYQETQEIIRRAIDHAEKNEVYILLENVWASYLIEPLGMARFIDEINSPWVMSYFDVGNVVRWGWPQHWIEVLGQRIKKLDIKEFDLNVAMNEGLRKGFGKPLGEGSIDWTKVRDELRKIDYRGWATAEVPGGDRAHLADIAAQMNRVLDL